MDKIGIIGLGYVGLPLAAEFGKVREVIGFDINRERIEELKQGHDRTCEVEADELNSASKLSFSSDQEDLRHVKYFIVTHKDLNHRLRGVYRISFNSKG